MDGSHPAPINGASLTPDAATALAFLEWAFAGSDAAALIEIAFSDDDGGAIRRARLFPNTPAGREEAAQFAAQVNARPGVNVYVAPALRLASAARDKRSSRRDFASCALVWADFDEAGASAKGRDRWREVGLPPHRVVVTGRTPNTRAQAFWRLAEPFTDPDALDSALAGVHVGLAFLADPKVLNVDRVMRLPGMIAWPKPGKEGRVPELTELSTPQGARPAPIGLAEFHAVFPPRDAAAARKNQDAAPGDADLFGARPAPVAAETRVSTPSTPLPPAPTSTPAPERAFDMLGRRIDGRDEYAMRVIGGAIRGLAARLGRWPTAEELAAEAWPTYERNVGPKNPARTIDDEGRGWPWFWEKCGTHARRAASGQIRGLETVEKCVEAERAKVTPGAPGASVSNDAPAAPRALELLAFEDDAIPVLDHLWLIDGVLPLNGFAVLYGRPGSAKTFTAIAMALSIASGEPDWRGHSIEPGAVLYLSLEGQGMFGNRLAAWRSLTGRTAPHFFRSPTPLTLRTSEGDAQAVIAAGRAVAERAGAPVRLVVVDTLARAMAGNENASEDMGAFVRACDAIRVALSCCVLVIHHSGKTEASGMRGHSSLLGAVDTELHMIDGGVRVDKQKDGEEGAIYGVALETVPLGVSAKGQSVRSAVAVPADYVPSPPEKKALPDNARHVLEALTIFVDDFGKPNPAGTGWPEPGRFRVVEWDAFRAFARDRMPQEGQRKKNEAVRRGVNLLIKAGVAAMNGGFVWLTR